MTLDNKKSKFTTETVFPVLIAVLSLLNILKHSANFLALTNLLSLVGIVGTILYFKKNNLYKKVIYLWILAQVIVVDREILDEATGIWINKPYWDLTQVISVKLGF